MRVLVAEDDEVLASAVAVGLRREGMAVDIAVDGDDALAHLGVNRYDVVVLDRDLPGTDGDEVCRALVADRSASRVLMLTAASTVKDRVEGLGLGADDYLPKPFEFAEAGRPHPGSSSTPGDAASRTGLRRPEPRPRPASRVSAPGCVSLSPAKNWRYWSACSPQTGKPGLGRGAARTGLGRRAPTPSPPPWATIGRLRAKLGDPPVIETVRESGYRIGGP